MTTDYLRETHHEFLAASEEALADPRLQQILGQLGDTLGRRNREAWAALPNSDLIRERARGIKDESLADLDKHLATLADNVTARGGNVHWADDGAAACQIIVDLIRQRCPTLTRRASEGSPPTRSVSEARKPVVVKSKSMTSEEIHLNHALEAAGIEAVETDLGEYIIQLAQHRPSHIVAPAIHLTAAQIAEILSKPAGERLPAERQTLAQFARRTLRKKFAEADIGISGANFGIAETGSIVLVTNEGNGRLTCAMPKCHIAVMGIEKVIPRLADLPYFLKVLARAATGQKLSIYTQIITGPRRAGELDGPEEFHLVILDNGRSRILGGPLRESLFCIRCGACLNACPIYRSVGGHAYGGVYAGPIGAVLTPLYDGLSANHHLPNASSLCGACQAACPVKIQIPQMLIQLREQLHQVGEQKSRMESFGYWLWAATAKRPWLYRLATWLASRTIGRFKRHDPWLTQLPGQLSGWTQKRDFPAPAHQRFRDWWAANRNEDQI